MRTAFERWLAERYGASAPRLLAEAQGELDRMMGLRARGMAGVPAPAGYECLRIWLEEAADLKLAAFPTSSDLAAVAVLSSPHREIAYFMRRYGAVSSQLAASRAGDYSATGRPDVVVVWRLPRAGHFPAAALALDLEAAGVLRALVAWGQGVTADRLQPAVDSDFILRSRRGSPAPRKLHQLWYTTELARQVGALPDRPVAAPRQPRKAAVETAPQPLAEEPPA